MPCTIVTSAFSADLHGAPGVSLHLSLIDWLILLVYFVFVPGTGFALKRYIRTGTDFFLAGRSIPACVFGLAFLSANLGAQDISGMGHPERNTASLRATSWARAIEASKAHWSLQSIVPRSSRPVREYRHPWLRH